MGTVLPIGEAANEAIERLKSQPIEPARKPYRGVSPVQAWAPRFATVRLSTSRKIEENAKAIEHLIGYGKKIIEGHSGWAVLWGKNGTGKTHLMAGLANAVWAHGKSVVIENHGALLDRIKRRAFGKDDGTVEEILREWIGKSNLICIDEFGQRDSSATDAEITDHIVDYLYRHMRALCITTNKEPGAEKGSLEEALGLRVVSRLLECADVIACNWPSFRGQK